MSDWILTASGRKFSFLDPKPENVRIDDIAHALSLICRFGGHVRYFYSVAAHSMHVAKLVKPENALLGLLHDSPESYLGDMVRPLKRQMPAYQLAEARLETVIFDHFGLDPTDEQWADVKRADQIALATERAQLMPAIDQSELHPDERELEIDENWVCAETIPHICRAAFLHRFYELSGGYR